VSWRVPSALPKPAEWTGLAGLGQVVYVGCDEAERHCHATGWIQTETYGPLKKINYRLGGGKNMITPRSFCARRVAWKFRQSSTVSKRGVSELMEEKYRIHDDPLDRGCLIRRIFVVNHGLEYIVK
jgi:hypothetical protein